MTPARRPPVQLRSYVFTFALIASFLILAHGPLLRLPFYWDEAGQFVPAALDLFRAHLWIPVSTVPNVHPPGVMVYLAVFWSVFGFSIENTRIAMLLVASLAALWTFLLAIELGRGAPGTPAITALVLLCVSPLFFAQSMLAQLDMPAMCLSTLALLLFLQDRFRASAIACAALVLVKETGIVAPALFGCWLLWERRPKRALWFLLPIPGLAIWLLALRHATGYWFGNPAFTSYNLLEPLHPTHVLVALLRRGYYLFIGSGHFIGAAVLVWAVRRMPLLRTRPWRIAGAFVAVHMLIVTVLGGAVLERYLLPTLPVVYAAFAVALRAVMPRTRLIALAGLLLCLGATNFINPVYPFPFENNLAFAGFVQLEESASAEVELRAATPIAAAFPVADALRNPDLGFVQSRHNIVELADYSAPEIAKLMANPPAQLVVYNRVWDPLNLLGHPAAEDFLATHFDYVPQMPAEKIAATLSMHVVRRWERRGLTMKLLERSAANY